MAHVFPAFAMTWQWFYCLFTMYQGFMAQYQSDRFFGARQTGTSYYQFEMARYMFVTRHNAQAFLGIMGLLSPPKWTGCIFGSTAFWIFASFTSFFDACVQWQFSDTSHVLNGLVNVAAS